jgi:hypothetical protein
MTKERIMKSGGFYKDILQYSRRNKATKKCFHINTVGRNHSNYENHHQRPYRKYKLNFKDLQQNVLLARLTL